MDLRVTWQAALVLIVGIGGSCVGMWWLFVRAPRPPRQEVSAAWRDEQLRGRRE